MRAQGVPLRRRLAVGRLIVGALLQIGCSSQGGDEIASLDAHTDGTNDAPSEAGSDAPSSCQSTADCPPGLTCETVDGQPLCVPPPTPAFTNQGGVVLDAMEIWTVVWPGDEATGAALDAFRGAFLKSAAWTDRVAEYGVGAGKAMGVLVLSTPPPATVTQSVLDAIVPTLIGQQTVGGSTVPAPNANTVFGFLIPKGSTESDGYYHTTTSTPIPAASGPALYVPYIVDRQDDVGYVSAPDYLTWSDSHELVECATDPNDPPAWACPWMPDEGEVADLCDDIPATESVGGKPTMLTRTYSAARASARVGDPCIPTLPGAYENIAIVPGEVVVPAGIGASTSVHLRAFTYGPTTSMHWALFPDLSYTATPASGDAQPGDDIVVTFQRTSASPGYTTALYLWITPPNDPTADVPVQEWIGGISESP